MSHMIEHTNDLAYAGTVPWHGLGNFLPSHATGEEMIAAANLDWRVVERPLYAGLHATERAVDLDGEHFVAGADRVDTVDTHKALFREDTGRLLGVVSRQYGVIQNRDALGLMEAAVGTGAARYEVAGSLEGGKRVWLLARTGDVSVVGESIRQYLLVTTAHDGTAALTIRFTPVRVVCQNTLSAALGRRAATVTVRHTSNAEARVKQAVNVVEQARDYFGEFHEAALKLAGKWMTHGQFVEVARALAPDYENAAGDLVTPRLQAQCIALFDGQANSSDLRISNTRWGAFNAITAAIDHNSNARSQEARMKRALTGSADQLKSRAMELLLAA